MPTQNTKDAPAVTIAGLADAFSKDAKGFVGVGTKIVNRISKHREETPEIGQAIITLGLHVAVLVRHFALVLSKESTWFGRTSEDYVRFEYGVGAKDYFPPKAFSNARLALAITVSWDADGKFTPGIFPEKDFLETSQAGLDALTKIVFHKKTADAKGTPDPKNAVILRAVQTAANRGKKYVAQLKAILDELEGKTNEEETAKFDIQAAIDGLDAVTRNLGAETAETQTLVVHGISRLGEVMTHLSGLGKRLDEIMASYKTPEDVQAKILLTIMDGLPNEVGQKPADETPVAPVAPVAETPVEPDFVGWVAANQYDDETKAVIGLEQDELDSATIEQVRAFFRSENRLPQNIGELDEYSNGEGRWANAQSAAAVA